MKVKVGNLQVGDVVWIDNDQATILSVNKKADGYDVYFKIHQSLPLTDFYRSKWIRKGTEVSLVC